MNRKILALVLALVAVAAVIVLAVTLNDDTPAANLPSGGTAAPTPGDHGLEDSIFDAEETKPVETQAPDATEDPAVVPGAAIPDGPAATDTGLQAPDVDAPEDTRPVQTEPTVTEPKETKPVVTEPAQTGPQQTEPVQIPEGEIDYETFTAMEPALQRQYMESFESMDAFFEWYNAAKEAYEQEHPVLDVGDGVIDVEDLLGQGS